MIVLSYESLPRTVRREARRLAKQLVRTVPAAEKSHGAASIRGAVNSCIEKPENLEAAFVYGDDENHWWGDIVLKKSDGSTLQIGTSESEPHKSYDEAFDHVKGLIASLKAPKEEHPIVQDMRAKGLDPEKANLLRVTHEAFGVRYVWLDSDHIHQLADLFSSVTDQGFQNLSSRHGR